ncbi:hypothetical protein BOTBODRAFT_183291 [Botryobasidium botryosum FD-172 SS1]|uniref:DUF7918 domain-containing protein n=1 Tax=Botryobasidium botryosum (strain FD-172 SS1) TaxID=930990 RepID=A0A067N0N1_BOTB1|nr:hypothetical protein BOTBODRAFT_183291 [Botryobasidium botryosum FD-172 SS1]
MPLTHRGYSVWISSNGGELEQFGTQIQEDDRSAITCWIPSVEGEKFQMSAAFGAFRGNDPGVPKVSSGSWISSNEIKPFLFSRLALTDDDSVATSAPSDLGTIRLSFWRVVYSDDFYKGRITSADGTVRPEGPVHERCKKAGSHVVILGSAEVADAPQPETRMSYSWVDPCDKPYGTFIFRYRPLDLLQAKGLAPLPGPGPDTKHEIVKVEDTESDTGSETERDSDSDSGAEEIRALEEKLREARARRAGKRKYPGKSETFKKLKVEQADLSGYFQPGEIIDLTFD